MLGRLEQGLDPRDIPGLVSRDDQGQVQANDLYEGQVDLAALPDLAWDLLDDYPASYHAAATYLNKTPFTDLIVSRGCRYVCTFCDNQTFGRSIRALPVEITKIGTLVNPIVAE